MIEIYGRFGHSGEGASSVECLMREMFRLFARIFAFSMDVLVDGVPIWNAWCVRLLFGLQGFMVLSMDVVVDVVPGLNASYLRFSIVL